MNPSSLDPATQSTCTSCTFSEDFSNYWTASMYFKSPENGTYKRVPQMANGRLDGGKLEQDGGLTVYYMRPFSGSNKKTTQFKPVGGPHAIFCTSRLTYWRVSACSPETQLSARRKALSPAFATVAWVMARVALPVTARTHPNFQPRSAPRVSGPQSSSLHVGMGRTWTARTTSHMLLIRVMLCSRAINVQPRIQ